VTTQIRRLGGRPHGEALSILARARSAPLQALAEALLDVLPPLEVMENRTGLVMLPMIDTVKGATFHLGEALVSEARVRCGGAEGYGMILGHDLVTALAMAVVDAAGVLDMASERIAALIDAEAAHQAETEHARLREVAATRVEMETF
jgi:alpha-D-ribose 1-methylphosphonate 5-triphosphate synthase subunit PhnG